MKANDYQIAGSHYQTKSGLQHWDIADRYVGYLEGYASKYVMRWRKTATGYTDLEKARHAITKLIERATHEGRLPRMNYPPKSSPRHGVPKDILTKFLHDSGVTDTTDRAILTLILTWEMTSDLIRAVELLTRLIDDRPEPRHVDKTGQAHPFGYDPNEDEGR